MSNLGLYQFMTSTAKKVGGPKAFLVGVGLIGYCIGRPIEAGIKKLYHKVKSHKKQKTENVMYSIHTDGTTSDGIVFNAGDKFRVLDVIDDGLLIEKIGDFNNPYIVALEFIASISDYNQKHEANAESNVASSPCTSGITN